MAIAEDMPETVGTHVGADTVAQDGRPVARVQALESQARAERAHRRRQHMQVRLASDFDDEVDFSTVTGAAAMVLAAQLSTACWSLAAREAAPDHERSEMPVCLRMLGEKPVP